MLNFMMDECGLLCANDEFLCVCNFRSHCGAFSVRFFKVDEDVGIEFFLLPTDITAGRLLDTFWVLYSSQPEDGNLTARLNDHDSFVI